MENKVIIGRNIAKQRLMRGLSQEELGELLSVSRQSVSKWELGQAMPDVEKIILLSKSWGISTDDLIIDCPQGLLKPSKSMLNWGLYLIVKDFNKSIHFYEQLLQRRAIMIGHNRFAQFRFNGNCILSIMNEKYLDNHETQHHTPHKFALNLWTTDLGAEFKRIKDLHIGPFTDITSYHPAYHYFNLVDPDYNLIEITGEFHESGNL